MAARSLYWLCLAVAVSLATPSRAIGEALAPAAGTLLVATRSLQDSGFTRSIVLIIQHDEDGTMGLIINQPTDTLAAELLPDIRGLERFDNRLFIGGPVAAWGVIMLVQSTSAPDNALHVIDNVYTSGDLALLEAMIASGRIAADVRLYAGHAGWLPGQLAAEIERGSWRVMAARAELIFSPEPLALWDRLVRPAPQLIVGTPRIP